LRADAEGSNTSEGMKAYRNSVHGILNNAVAESRFFANPVLYLPPNQILMK
jgi:hypothetical protein